MPPATPVATSQLGRVAGTCPRTTIDVTSHAAGVDAALIDAWNARVGPRDAVRHLGDFAFRSVRGVPEIAGKLNGRITLLLGNHDARRPGDAAAFERVADVLDLKHHGRRLWPSHYARRVWPRSGGGAWHLYGHSHGTLPDDPHALSMDVGVDAVARRLAPPGGDVRPADYRPAHLDEVAAWTAAKAFEPVDHHGRGVGRSAATDYNPGTMTDTETRERLVVVGGNGADPYLMLPLDQLEEVLRLLDRNGVEYAVAEDAIQLDGHPVIATIDFGRRSDLQYLQDLLDGAE